MSGMIELRQLSKRFGQRWAVSELDLTVQRGEISGLLGHNGAGKSTAIGMMLGQVWPTSGEVIVCGHEVSMHRQRALQKVGAIFETPVFYDFLSGWQNLEILSQYTAATPSERLEEVVTWVGLNGREHTKVQTYSHGMRTRLALAQALLPQPELLILDEPGDGLDPEGIHEMRQTILRLRDELKLTILLSSHLLNEVEQLCDRITVINQGRKIFEGTLAEATKPRNWVRLKVGDFEAARKNLAAEKLIASSQDGQLVELAEGVGTEVIVRRLVELGMPVFEIVREEQTLEGFYLQLMEESRSENGGAKQASLPEKH